MSHSTIVALTDLTGVVTFALFLSLGGFFILLHQMLKKDFFLFLAIALLLYGFIGLVSISIRFILGRTVIPYLLTIRGSKLIVYGIILYGLRGAEGEFSRSS